MINKIYELKSIFIGLFLIFFMSSCGERMKENQDDYGSAGSPNIIWIMSDDHSYQTLSAYDDRYIQTPNMDRIVEDGVRFTNSFVGNSLALPAVPPCRPASILIITP